MVLTVEELLAGGSITHELEIDQKIIYPNDAVNESENPTIDKKHVKIKPLTVQDLQIISKASKENELLMSSLMINRALIEPKLSIDQISGLHSGLVKFLVDKINQISGLDTPKDDLEEYVQTPLAKACFILAKEFGWTPAQVSEMTIGQILLYLEMNNKNE